MTSTWKFGSTDLTSLGAYNVINFEDAQGMPKHRGDNPVIPLREGRLFVKKIFDQRPYGLGMYIKGSSRTDFESKMDTFRKLFGQGNQQFLQRTMADGSVRKAAAEVTKYDVSQKSNRYARVTVDFLLDKPFFRSTVATSDTQTIDSNPKTYTLTNPGTAEDRSAVITFTGPLSYPKLTNLITDPVTGLAADVWVGYTGALTAGQTVVIDVAAGTCLFNGANALNQLIHSGDTYFMVLKSGANSMKVDSSVTGGTVKVEFYAPYF